MAAPRIQDYAVIGDCRAAALVSREGAVDWLCWPRFDSPSHFGALLDRRAGTFRIAPAAPFRSERRYEPGTNVLVTEFRSGSGALRLTDAMTVDCDGEAPVLRPEHELLRLAECTSGEVEVELVFDPRPDYGLAPVRLQDLGALGWRVRDGGGELILLSQARLAPRAEGGLAARVRMRAGDSLATSLSYSAEAPAVLPPLGDWTRETLRRTRRAWQAWSSSARYDGPYREAVVRSALALKLLAFSPSGAIVAAPTTSLPERPRSDLNWDYRFCWLRDASLTARALFGLGYESEARAFVSWLLHATRLTRPRLHVLYDVFGRLPGAERTLPLEGFGGARPVRIGNAAQDQLQLDVFGEVVDAAAQFVDRCGGMDRETARALRELGNYVCRRWREPDEGIWEVRSGRRAHTHSRVLCWAALDRLLALHGAGLLHRAPAQTWRRERAAIRRAIEETSWNPELGSYVAVPGGRALDAALLLLPLYGFAPADSPRMRRTWERLRAELGTSSGWLYRYRVEDGEGEGAFGACGFWAVHYLAAGGGTLAEAEALMERLLGQANDVGLYAEEIDPASGDALGNFPQGFSHIGLVNAAMAIEERRERERRAPARAGGPRPAPGAEARP